MKVFTEFYSFVTNIGFEKFFRYFYFFVIFEFFRFFVLELFVLLYWLGARRARRGAMDEAHLELMTRRPLVSVIVPGKNEGKHLFKLVESLRKQTYTNLQIIIVDDGSDDDTPIIGRNLERRGYIDLFLRNDVRGGKASAANLALRYSRGEFIVALDADCNYLPDAIEKILIPFYYDKDIGGVGGNVQVYNYNESVATALQAIEYYDTISVGRIVSSELGLYRVISGAFGAFRKEAIDKIGGWDVGPGMDGDISVKLKKLGYKVKFEPSAVCRTNVPNTFKKLANQRLRWDKSLIRFRLRKHMDVFMPTRTFLWINFFSFLENVVYNIFLNFKWYFYIGDMFINFLSFLPFIVVTNIILYATYNIFKYLVFGLFRLRRMEAIIYLLPFVPLMVFYFGYFLRIVRTRAYFQEFLFKASYDDNWNPAKSSKAAKALRI
jgi:cellulose synthase/poly-beta-1,6-N-acetylglucosamine synthase-like glycosyltransferase